MKRLLLGLTGLASLAIVSCGGSSGGSDATSNDPVKTDPVKISAPACKYVDRQKAFRGCGFLYEKESDRKEQCNKNEGAFKLVFSSAGSCPTLIREQEIFIGCANFAYVTEKDRQTQCGKGSGTLKWIPAS